MVSVSEWMAALPKPWELASGHRWHIYLGYSSDLVRLIEFYDALAILGYKVLHEKHVDWALDALDHCETAVLVKPLAGSATGWYDERLEALEQRARRSRGKKPPFRIVRLDSGQAESLLGANLLNLLYQLRAKAPGRSVAKLAEELDREGTKALEEIARLPLKPKQTTTVWEGSPFLLTRLADALIQKAQYREALEILQEAGQKFPGALRCRQLRGSALARLGRVREAREAFETILKEGLRDPETLGIYARTLMDSYDRTGKKEDLRRSRDSYAEAFRISPSDYYTGINAAAKSVFLGDWEKADQYNRQVQEILQEELPKAKADDYWIRATDGEVKLIEKRYDDAAATYRQAVISSPDKIGSHFSTWLQAKRLMNALKTPESDRTKIWRVFQHVTDMAPNPWVTAPPCRRLRVFAFDPSLAQHLATAPINEITLKIPWESKPDGESTLQPGPVGEYLEVVDYDPASACFYEAVNLDDPRLLAMDGLAPSEGDPKFHQQMVYAIAMNLIDHWERAVGRPVLWSSRQPPEGEPEEYVQRLRIYPHAFRGTNAYYSPQKKAVLFGYFRPHVDEPDLRGTVFTCLSHDVVTHEMTHALLDGLHPRFTERSNPDVFALHEAVADLIALFQHFSHSQVLRSEIARTRSDLGTQNLLGQLAQQFGRATGKRGALRDALGATDEKTGEWRPTQPSPDAFGRVLEPHARGSILVGAIFDAFLAIYQSRTSDLLRIATQGSGILPLGALHPDLVDRLAREAAKIAGQFLRICIRALDYSPPVDVTFGDYLRAMITGDMEFVRDDRLNYRLAILEGFQRRGIYPDDVRNLSVESLVWRPPRRGDFDLRPMFEQGRLKPEWRPSQKRKELWDTMRANASVVKEWMQQYCSSPVGDELGLSLGADSPAGVFRESDGTPHVDVHSVRLARRNTVEGSPATDLVVEILQKRKAFFDRDKQTRVDEGAEPAENWDFTFLGGCTLLIDPSDCRIRYSITKHILSGTRLERERRFRQGEDPSLAATYFGDPGRDRQQREPFAFLHREM